MKRILKIVTAVIFAFMATSCSALPGGTSASIGGSSSNGHRDNDPVASVPAKIQSIGFGDEVSIKNDSFYKKYSAEEKALYYTIWDPSAKISLSIDIEPSELYKIQEAYNDYKATGNKQKADTYRRCNLTVNVNGTDYYFEEVGIRMRGNTSRRNFCTVNGVMYDFVHFRFDLTETFDGDDYSEGAWAHDLYKTWEDSSLRKARKDRTFATMEKFYYKWNKNFDKTYVREVYANKMFSAYGVLAPHITLCQIKIKQNGIMENLGVGGLYETVDKRFIKRNFEKSLQGGDLYKCGYVSAPADFTSASNYGVETPVQNFTYSLKTNNDRESEDYRHNADLKNFINTLNALDERDGDFEAKLKKVVDVDYFTTFEAVNYLVGNPDCIRHNANNFYLYFTPDKIGYIIPYDYDRCFGVTRDWNPDGKALTAEKPFDVIGPCFKISNPLYVKTVLSGKDNPIKQNYAGKIVAILSDDWFKYANYGKIYKQYADNYSSVAKPSDNVRKNVSARLAVNEFYFSEKENNSVTAGDNLTVEAYFRFKRNVAENALGIR